jgi:hypothetical protein
MQKLGLVVLVCGTMLCCTGVGAQPTRITPTGINGVIDVHAYGAIGDGIADDTNAIQAALDAAAGTGATVMLPPTAKNLWVISSQLTVPSKVVFEGQCGSGIGMGSADKIQGSVLLWRPKPQEKDKETAIVYFHDVNRSALRCMTIENDDLSVTKLTGILYDSDNSPPSSYNTFEKFFVKGANIGFACGLTTQLPVYCVGQQFAYTGTSGNSFANLEAPNSTKVGGVIPAGTRVIQPPGNASTTTTRQVALPASSLPVASVADFAKSGTIVVGPPAVPGCFEADTARIEDFEIWGTETENQDSNTNDEGIHINSANCFQGSVIEKGSFQGQHVAVHIVNANGGLRLLSLNGGHSPHLQDQSAVFLQFDPAVVSSPDLWDIETEGKYDFSVHDSACNSFAGSPGSPTWIGNQFNHPVLADGCETITSIGNNAGVGPMSASGTTQVVSINEAKWGSAGSGQSVTCSGPNSPNEFANCTGGDGFMPQNTIVTQPPNLTTATRAPISLPTSTIPVLSTNGFIASQPIFLGTSSVSVWNNGVLVTDFLAATQFVKDGCSGTAVLSSQQPKVPRGAVTVTEPCLGGATVVGVAEITSGTPNALGWSRVPNTSTITIRSSSGSDDSEVAWWRLR